MKQRFSLNFKWPVRVRLTLLFTVLLMLSLLGLGLSLYFVVSNTLDNRLRTEFKNNADYTLSDVTAHHPDSALILPGALKSSSDDEPLLDVAGKPQIASALKADSSKLNDSNIIYDTDGNVLAQTSEGLQSTSQLVTLALAARFLANGQSQVSLLSLPNYNSNNTLEPFLVYLRPIYGLSDPTNEQSPPKLLGIYLDSHPYLETQQLLETMRSLLLVGVPISLLLSLLVGFVVAGRALRPIHSITVAARQIGATDLSRRIGLKSQDELGQLAQTFDQMLERLEGSFSRQKRFVADASHELRTPLAVIEAEATLMLRRERDVQDYQRALTLIAAETGRMRYLIEDLLTLARADSGEIELLIQHIALDDLAAEAVERVSLLTQPKNQRLQLEVSEEIWLDGDPEILTGLMVNLLSNAVKYTPNNGLIQVRVKRVGSSQAVFEVEDTGPGIAPEHLPHLFDRFYRVSKARKRQLSTTVTGEAQPSSSGLGLAIAQWAAVAHGGRIEVSSTLGQGSIFTLFLPLKPD
jgi:heavy metal sensor kinase